MTLWIPFLSSSLFIISVVLAGPQGPPVYLARSLKQWVYLPCCALHSNSHTHNQKDGQRREKHGDRLPTLLRHSSSEHKRSHPVHSSPSQEPESHSNLHGKARLFVESSSPLQNNGESLPRRFQRISSDFDVMSKRISIKVVNKTFQNDDCVQDNTHRI